jgi:hypothetical protein
MKKPFILPLLMLAVAAMLTNFFAQRVCAQATSGTMTAEQVTAIKAIKISNLDKDTYFKAGGFILDRYEERPAYVFTYSDGITRKVYLYKVFSAADTKELGLLAIYQNTKTGDVKPFVLPGASADRKAWDAYIDDLKYIGEKEPGLMSALTFVLSREMMTLMNGGTGKTDDSGSKKKEEYNFCFAPDAPITLANGSVSQLAEIRAGDTVMGYDAKTKTTIPTRVIQVDIHRGTFSLAGLWIEPILPITASQNRASVAPILLEATANHPVLTESGRKPLGSVAVGEVLYRIENTRLIPYRVTKTEATTRTVSEVRNLVTAQGAYLVSDVVVLDK